MNRLALSIKCQTRLTWNFARKSNIYDDPSETSWVSYSIIYRVSSHQLELLQLRAIKKNVKLSSKKRAKNTILLIQLRR